MAELISPADSRSLSTGYYGSFKLTGLHFFYLPFLFFPLPQALSEKAQPIDWKQGQAKRKEKKNHCSPNLDIGMKNRKETLLDVHAVNIWFSRMSCVDLTVAKAALASELSELDEL